MGKQQRLDSIRLLPLLYLALNIVLITLQPFQFQAYTPTEFWVIRFRLNDVAQNLLLFLPFGFVLRHSFRMPLWKIGLYGLLLSLSVEVSQLFLASRTSNVIDLLSNSCGTMLGALFHRRYFWHLSPRHRSLLLASLSFPVCWISALRSHVHPLTLIAIIPWALLSLSLLPPPCSKRQRIQIRFLWLGLLALPSVAISPESAWIVLLLLVPFAIWMPTRAIAHPLIAIFTLTGLSIVLFYNPAIPARNTSISYQIALAYQQIETLLAILASLILIQVFLDSSPSAEK